MKSDNIKKFLRDIVGTTTQDDGTEVVTYQHPTDGECPHCGVVHDSEIVETHPADELAERYAGRPELPSATVEDIPGRADEITQGLKQASQNSNLGHGRFLP